MALDVGVDVTLLKSEIRKTYASVSQEPEKDFIFPTGRAWAEDLGYPDEVSLVPGLVAESFAGVANPGVSGGSSRDSGCSTSARGAGMDSLIAALMVGPEGCVTGIDMTPEMIENARNGAAELGLNNVTFVEGEAEALPFEDSTFEVVISNGVST